MLAIYELLEILADTEVMNYFRCGFVQRLIEFQWNGPLVKYYKVVSGCSVGSFFLIASTSILLHWMNIYPTFTSHARIILMTLNLFLLILSLCIFEIKSFLEDRVDYFRSFWKWNYVLLFLFSFFTLLQEIYALVKGRIEILELEQLVKL